MELQSGFVEVNVSAGVMEISLHRPERKNAINHAMYQDLGAVIAQGVDDEQVRVLLLAGSDGCFTSGNDLADFANRPDLLNQDSDVVRFMTALKDCPKPVVAAVEGVAVGIGTTLLLHCDLVYAEPDASFRLPFVNLGLCPEFASSWLLPRLMGHVKAAELLLLGEAFSAAQALQVGLINAVTDNPLAVAREQALKLANQPSQAVRTTKALMKQPNQQTTNTAVAREIEEFGKALQGQEFQDAVRVFFEK